MAGAWLVGVSCLDRQRLQYHDIPKCKWVSSKKVMKNEKPCVSRLHCTISVTFRASYHGMKGGVASVQFVLDCKRKVADYIVVRFYCLPERLA